MLFEDKYSLDDGKRSRLESIEISKISQMVSLPDEAKAACPLMEDAWVWNVVLLRAIHHPHARNRDGVPQERLLILSSLERVPARRQGGFSSRTRNRDRTLDL